jgi:hypothetical protein
MKTFLTTDFTVKTGWEKDNLFIRSYPVLSVVKLL